MRGLLINNYYAVRSNVKVFSIVMFLLGVFVVIIDNDTPAFIIGYMLLCMVGFSLNMFVALRKECACKWGKYKLTTPVKRSDIVKSYFISLLIWLLVGMIFAGAGVSISVLLHGFPFARNTDVLMLFVTGIGISFFMAAIFFPLFYFGGEEKNEVFLIISLLSAVGIITGLVRLINLFFGPKITTLQIILAAVILFASSLLAFILSYPATVILFKRKQY